MTGDIGAYMLYVNGQPPLDRSGLTSQNFQGFLVGPGGGSPPSGAIGTFSQLLLGGTFGVQSGAFGTDLQ